MPELPEVETTVLQLNNIQPKIVGRKFLDFWTDTPKLIKKPSFSQFKKEILKKRIEKIWRRGKNIIFELSPQKYLLIHLKLTGSLLVGRWKKKGRKWEPEIEGPLKEDPFNRFLHLIFFLDDRRQIALSDLRKFAKVELLNPKELEEELSKLGPEPLAKDFTFEKFKEIFKNKKGKIKKVLMDQSVLSGIGNIYSDEILFSAKVHPLREIKTLTEDELKRIYFFTKKILKKAIQFKGTSVADYRNVDGKKGQFEKFLKVYRKEKCSVCGKEIKKLKLGERSSYFCPRCQK